MEMFAEMVFCDAHAHLSDCTGFSGFPAGDSYFCVSSCHSEADVESVVRMFGRPGPRCGLSGVPHFADAHSSALLRNCSAGAPYPDAAYVVQSFGIHPMHLSARNSQLAVLECLLQSRSIHAVGECGFDFFTPELRRTQAAQEAVFSAQLELAEAYGIPVVLHLRKSLAELFLYSRQLSRIPSVVFHSFPGTVQDAVSLLRRGINAYFSFGTPLIKGKKSAVGCVQSLPASRILLETDAPYQALNGETETSPGDIRSVYACACRIRGCGQEEFSVQVAANFAAAYGASFRGCAPMSPD